MKGLREYLSKSAAMVCLIMSLPAAAWSQDWGSGSKTIDTAKVDSTAKTVDASGSSAIGGGGMWGAGPGTEIAPMPARVARKRFNPPYDTLREIIYYEGIIEDENCETCSTDSLYWRAKKFLAQRYGKENLKKWTIEDKKNDRLTLKMSVPMILRNGEYKKAESGLMEYKLTIRFKDARYKYQFGNFVHLETPNGLGKLPTRTYHEYYMRVKKGYEVSDQYLIAADREVKEVVAGLKKSLRAPYQPDEDDW